MKIKILTLMEAILTLAVGFATARATSDYLNHQPYLGPISRALAAVGPAIVAMLIVGGIGTWAKCLLRRAPATWGIGRWTLTIFAAVIAADVLSILALHAAGEADVPSWFPPQWRSPDWRADLVQVVVLDSPGHHHLSGPVAWIATRPGRAQAGGPADAWEWAGRPLAVGLVAW